MNILREYPYLYETHLHTCEASACAVSTAEEMVKACKDYGYTGIVITNHNWDGNTTLRYPLPWDEWVHEFCRAYHQAKEAAEKIGLQVFFGYESCYAGTEFLIYGVDEKWLIANPQIKDASIEEQYRLVSDANGLVIHAHPYRKETYIPKIRLYPQFVDGIEGINATHSNHLSKAHNDPEFNALAIAYAREHNLPITAGSDVHSDTLFGGGVAFRRKLDDIKDYCDAIKGGEDYILTDGDTWYTKSGERIDAATA